MSASWQVTRGSSMRKHNNKRIPPNNRPQHPRWTPPMSKRHKDTLWSPFRYWWKHFLQDSYRSGVSGKAPLKKKKHSLLIHSQASTNTRWAIHLKYMIIMQWSFKCMDGIWMWIYECISIQWNGKCLQWYVHRFVGDWRMVASGN